MRKPLAILLALLTSIGPFIIHPTPASAQLAGPAPLLDPSALHGDRYGATDAQFASLQVLQQQAVANTLIDHDLPSSDALAAQTWGRGDALAELWYLLVEAIAKPKCTTGQTPGSNCRTTDQQNAVDWFSIVAQRQAVEAAEFAGLEYVKWAGLNQTTYFNLLNSGASVGQLTTFLHQGFDSAANYAVPVATWPPNTSCRTFNGTIYSEGYCAYAPPAPFQTEYSDGSNQTCFTACTSIAGCKPFGPSYDQLVKWGAADVNNQLFNTPGYAKAVDNVAVGVYFGLGTAAVVTALSLSAVAIVPAATITTVGTVAASTAIFPFAATIGVTIAGVASLVLIAVVAAIVAAIYAVELFDAEAVPGQLATFITGAATTPLDLAGMLNDAEKMGGLFALFVGATQPTPKPETCNFLDPETGAACLNAPAVPSASAQTDPQFQVKLNSGTASSPSLGTATTSSTISWFDAIKNTNTTARLHGNWFVMDVTDFFGTSTVQALRIHYVDWNGNGQTAWLRHYQDQGYKFLGIPDQGPSGTPLNVQTCLTDHTCSFRTTIQYVGTDHLLYEASVLPPPVPVVTANWSTNPVVEGSHAQFHAVATSPTGATITSYVWEFEDKIPGRICIADPLGNPYVVPCFASPISGQDPQYAFPTSGSFQGRVIVTDSTGLIGQSFFTVPVQDVPPQLTLYAACTPGVICLPPFNIPVVMLGKATLLSGTITHVGSQDVETVEINWGDGTTETNSTSPFVCGLACSQNIQITGGLTLTFVGTHTYASAGQYTATVTVTDQSGAKAVKTMTESALTETGVTLKSSTNPSVVGQGVTYTATIAPVPNGGTVAFSDGPFTISGCSAQPIDAGVATCTAALAIIGSHTIAAGYSGNNTYAASASSLPETVNQAATSTGITSSTNPSVWGQSVDFTATVSVTGPGAGSPTGTVTFKDGAADISGCTGQPVNTSTSKATCTTSALSVAGHSVTAVYSGDNNFIGSSTSALSHTVSRAATGTGVTSSKSPSTQGESVTFTATVSVTLPGAGAPTGTVTFKDGASTLGPGALSTNGGVTTATYTTSGLGAGPHSISASYGGDGNFLTSTASAITQYVNVSLVDFPKLPSGAFNLGGVNLKGAFFVGLNLAGANISNTNLTGAVFIGANLAGVNFSGTNLKNTNFTNANLTGANLTGANVNGATWSGATCPDGTSSAANGGTCLGHL
jgi:hypothetical protein